MACLEKKKTKNSFTFVCGKQLIDEFWVVNLSVLICLFVHVGLFIFSGKGSKQK